MKLYNISLNNIKRRKSKFIFLLIGLFIGVTTVVTLLSIIQSMTNDLEERLNQFGANIVMTPKTKKLSLSYGGISVGGVNVETKELAEIDLAKIKQIKNSKNIGVVAPKIIGTVKLNQTPVLLMGIDLEAEYALKTWWMVDGKFPENNNQLLIGSQAAAAFGLNIGDSVIFKDKEYIISAVLQSTGKSEDNIFMIDLHEAQTILEKQGSISLVEISAFCQGCPISEIVLQLAEKFPEARVTALKQAVMSKLQSIDMFRTFSYGVAVFIILIGAMLIFVTMMGAVNERTREIGIFRAIGFRRGHVMQVILLEALIVGIFSGILGFISGNLISWTALPYIIKDGTFVGFNWKLGGIAMLIAISLSLLASLYPAHKASKLDPSEALRTI